jgi:hypothetical protein
MRCRSSCTAQITAKVKCDTVRRVCELSQHTDQVSRELCSWGQPFLDLNRAFGFPGLAAWQANSFLNPILFHFERAIPTESWSDSAAVFFPVSGRNECVSIRVCLGNADQPIFLQFSMCVSSSPLRNPIQPFETPEVNWELDCAAVVCYSKEGNVANELAMAHSSTQSRLV